MPVKGRYASATEVPVERTRGEIERTLQRYGADQFLYGWESANAVIGFRMKGRMVRMVLPLPSQDDPAFTEYQSGSKTWLRAEAAAYKLWESFEVDGQDKPLDFLDAPDLERIADELQEHYELKFNMWPSLHIDFRWKLKGGKRAGQATFGKCQKTSGLLKHYSDRDFVIWLAADHCREGELTRFQVEALPFHEMLHVNTNDDGRAMLRGHDRELFCEEIEEYGLWEQNLQNVGRAVQGRLDELGEGALDGAWVQG